MGRNRIENKYAKNSSLIFDIYLILMFKVVKSISLQTNGFY